jgi:hypothetical protein
MVEHLERMQLMNILTFSHATLGTGLQHKWRCVQTWGASLTVWRPVGSIFRQLWFTGSLFLHQGCLVRPFSSSCLISSFCVRCFVSGLFARSNKLTQLLLLLFSKKQCHLQIIYFRALNKLISLQLVHILCHVTNSRGAMSYKYDYDIDWPMHSVIKEEYQII